MEYKAYPTKKTVKSRRSRKGARNAAFQYNRSLRGRLNRERRAAQASNS